MVNPCITELDDGTFYRKPLYLMVKTMVSGSDFPKKTNPLNVNPISKITNSLTSSIPNMAMDQYL